MSMIIQVALFRACSRPCAEQVVATSSFEFDCESVPDQEVRLHEKIHDAFERCEQRLADSIARHESSRHTSEKSGARRDRTQPSMQKGYLPDCDHQPPTATQRQIQALHGMMVRYRINLRRLLHDRFGKRHLYELTRNEAGCLIGEFQKLQGRGPAENQ